MAGKGGGIMAYIEAEDYRFSYPGADQPAVEIRGLAIEKGSFCLLAGASGSGKTTLLRQLSGNTLLQGVEEGRLVSHARQSSYVWQNPESQIVTDRAEYEIVFGLENINMPKEQMQRRLAEVVTFFGLEELMGRDTMSLSGGEMQTLNLAAAIAMDPDLLLLDEPASQLDPVAAARFYELLRQINEELGITVIIAEQRLEDIVAMADQMILMDGGRICLSGAPEDVFDRTPERMLSFFPSFLQLYHRMGEKGAAPLTRKAARRWFCAEFQPKQERPGEQDGAAESSGDRIWCKGLYFRYDRSQPDVLSNCSFVIPKGTVVCLAGGNGSGKSTLLEILRGRFRPYRGKCGNMPGRIAYLPQQPGYLFLKDTVEECCRSGTAQMSALVSVFGLDRLRHRHPADLSGGELQGLGLCQVLGEDAELYLLDEPAKGLDQHRKEILGRLLTEMAGQGKTVLFVSHDMEFAARYTQIMALMFQGRVPLIADTRSFFMENQFYTTGMNRIARDVSPYIITQEDVEIYAEKKMV